MEKANKGTDIAVAVTRLGSDPVPVVLTSDKRTVADALEKSGITTSGTTEYFVSGVKADMEDILEDGDVLALVTPKQAGA